MKADAATHNLATRRVTACRNWAWTAMCERRRASLQQEELAALHIASMVAKELHRALIAWRKVAVFNNQLFLFAAAARRYSMHFQTDPNACSRLDA